MTEKWPIALVASEALGLLGDTAECPDDDLVPIRTETGWRYARKNGEPYV